MCTHACRLCNDVMDEGYGSDKFNIYVHAARALCQHGAVVCIILYYGAWRSACMHACWQSEVCASQAGRRFVHAASAVGCGGGDAAAQAGCVPGAVFLLGAIHVELMTHGSGFVFCFLSVQARSTTTLGTSACPWSTWSALASPGVTDGVPTHARTLTRTRTRTPQGVVGGWRNSVITHLQVCPSLTSLARAVRARARASYVRT